MGVPTVHVTNVNGGGALDGIANNDDQDGIARGRRCFDERLRERDPTGSHCASRCCRNVAIAVNERSARDYHHNDGTYQHH